MSWNLAMNRLFNQDKSFFVTDKKWVTHWVLKICDWTIYLARFQLIRMSSYANNTSDVFSFNINVDIAKWVGHERLFTNSPKSTLTICVLPNFTCVDWTIYSWQGFNSLGCPLILTTNNRCVQSLNISVDVAKYLENVNKFNMFTHFLSVRKNDLSWLNNLFMAMFQLNRMSSYAKNKLQMCSVTQHQCIRHQMCGKCSQIHPVHSLFVRYKKRLVLIKQSIHGKVSSHQYVLLY